MPGIGRLVHVRDSAGICVPMLVTKIWNKDNPDYVQGTAFLDMVNDFRAVGSEINQGEGKGFKGCSSVTPSTISCGSEVFMKDEKTFSSGIALTNLEGARPADDNYAAWEFPFQKWHWPAKTD